MKPNLIALLTDFGLSDPYLGIMKGVISRISPDLKTIDLTHQIDPGDIQAGALHLWQSSNYFPAGTVFLAVVDPGVGSDRKGLYVQREGQIFIGPDNGLFSYVSYKADIAAWELSNPDLQLQESSSTFHGRDIFAPAAARAALGLPGEQFGSGIDTLIPLPRPRLLPSDCQINGEVLLSDRFGNLITSLGQFRRPEGKLELVSWIDDTRMFLPPDPCLVIDQRGTSLPLVSTFSDIEDGHCACLIGSSGLLEISSNQASAADLLGLERGDPVTFIWK